MYILKLHCVFSDSLHIQDFACSVNALFSEVSAKTSSNIEEAIVQLVHKSLEVNGLYAGYGRCVGLFNSVLATR